MRHRDGQQLLADDKATRQKLQARLSQIQHSSIFFLAEKAQENLGPMPGRRLADAGPMVHGSDKSSISATKTGRKKAFANRIREFRLSAFYFVLG